MYDEIKRRIEQRISEGPRLNIERIAAGDKYGERDTSLITSHVTSELERRMSEMYDETDASEAAAQPRDAVREFGGLRTRRQLERHFVEQLSVDIGGPIKAYNFTVPIGSRVFGPPYDLDWAVGNGVGNFSRFDGKVYTIPKDNGFSAAGVGFYLTTNEPVVAAITPQGTYNWNWVAFKNLPFARSRGGMGITIYTNTEPQPTRSYEPMLWSVSGIISSNSTIPLSGQKGSGRIADAASPAFGVFGPVPLAPTFLHMVPGARYLVWVWCWQTAQLEKDDPFIAFLSFSMPFVTINASPPILLH